MNVRPWSVPRIWRGQTAVVMGTGPSLTPDVVACVRGRARVIAVNDAYRLAPWAEVLYAADWEWWKHHWDDVRKFRGLKVSIGFQCPYKEVLAVADGGYDGFDDRPTHVRSGRNSGYQAVHLAAHLGAHTVLLCGFDMRKNKHAHFFGDHPPELRNESLYDSFIQHFTRAAQEYERRGIRVINCTPGSALKCFPFSTLEGALAGVSIDSRAAALSA